MSFVDEITVRAASGNGGPGVVRWLHIKGNDKAGPGGGDGGRGGDVILEGVRDLGALANYRYTKVVRAEHGEAGGSNEMHGADGEAAILKVPVGTVARMEATGETFEILSEGQQILLLRGGNGGLGNPHFKGPSKQNPMESTPGKPGKESVIHISLKLIADAGLIGFPNAGKSSLLNELTRARSKVGAYPFTTLDPHLGDFYGFILADIPGLIEGASEGRGLGSRFLKHIERTRFLVHLVSSEQEDVVAAYAAIRNELATFGHGLDEKEEIVVLSKVDMLTEAERKERVAALEKAVAAAKGEKGRVIELSILDDQLMKSFSATLTRELGQR